jgi:hypothetical protein
MMRIHHNDATKLSLVGKPVALPGDFPTTVAASQKNNLVCVGTTGTKNGISCSTFSHAGLGPMDALRTFDLVQTTPPVGPVNTVSQTFFSEDETKLYTTVKGNPAAKTNGFFSVFPVTNGCLSRQETRSSPAGTAVLFGSGNIPGTNDVFVTDASFGGAVLSLASPDNKAVTVGKVEIPGQKATCWATVSTSTQSAFVTDVLVDRIVEMSLKDASIISTVDLATGDSGLIDLRAAGDFVYALAPNAGEDTAAVTVLDVSGGQGKGKLLQHFTMKNLGVGRNAQGMVALV